MLSALAKYIFGGIMDDAPEESMQCETREVNDWLLINMPNQVDDMDFESEDEKGPDSEDDLENISEEEDDDILTALPFLLMQEIPACDTSCSENAPPNKQNICLDTRLATQSTLLSECIEDFQILPEAMYVNHSLYYPSDFSLALSQINNLRYFCQNIFNSPKALVYRDTKVMQIEKILNTLRQAKDVIAPPDKRTCKPVVYPRSYINHRSSVLPPKEELLEQIKLQKPSQRAMQHDMRKHISRSKVNRQNKNYIYETSVKKNRRSNLQRHHSGANNNRKC